VLSALNQTYNHLEILIIDDKGTDNSIDIVRNLKSTHPRGACIRVIDNLVNKGSGASREIALENARGEYFYFLDSDDYIEVNTIEILYDALVKSDVDMSVGAYAQLDHSKVWQNEQLDNLTFVGPKAMQDYYYSPYYNVVAWNKLYRTRVLRENHVSCFSMRLYEDAIWMFQLFGAIKSIVLCKDVTYYYRCDNPHSLTKQHSIKLEDLHFSVILFLMQEMEKLIKTGKVPLNDATYAYFVRTYSDFMRDIVKIKSKTFSEKLSWFNKAKQFNDFLSKRKLRAREHTHLQTMYILLPPYVACFWEWLIFNFQHKILVKVRRRQK
jgi:glycosyltransferase involved in cell wall biosynthesis